MSRMDVLKSDKKHLVFLKNGIKYSVKGKALNKIDDIDKEEAKLFMYISWIFTALFILFLVLSIVIPISNKFFNFFTLLIVCYIIQYVCFWALIYLGSIYFVLFGYIHNKIENFVSLVFWIALAFHNIPFVVCLVAFIISFLIPKIIGSIIFKGWLKKYREDIKIYEGEY